MPDVEQLREHVKQLSNSDLQIYLREAMRNGDDARAAIADQEVRHRREMD